MIFYFTGTGNSLYVARKIQEKIGGKLIDIAISLNEKKFNYKVEKGEKVGIVFPVYYWGLPTIVSEFIKELKLETDETPFIYTVITCASLTRNADKYLAKLLKSKDLQLNSSYSVKMPTNYTSMHPINYVISINPPKKEDISSSLDLAENQIEKLIESIKNNEKGYFTKHSSIEFFSFFVYMLYGIFRKTKKFYTNKECKNCGQCERICSSQVINMKNGKPEWTERECSHCTSCINRCPSRAIEYGNSTKKQERYVNPNVKFDNIM